VPISGTLLFACCRKIKVSLAKTGKTWYDYITRKQVGYAMRGMFLRIAANESIGGISK